MSEHYLIRRTMGGLWIKRRGHKWQQASIRYWDLCRSAPSVYSVTAMEDHTDMSAFLNGAMMVMAMVLAGIAIWWAA